MKDCPRLVIVRLLHDPSIARYLDTAAQLGATRQVLLIITEKLDVDCLILTSPSLGIFAKIGY